MPRPLFSIIMAVHRPAMPLLGPNLVHLARHQEFAPPFEVLIAPDDGGDYRGCIPPELLFNDSMSVRVVERARFNTGPGLARNDAAEQARGDYFVLLDADDHLAPDFLRIFAKHFARKSNGAAIAPTRVVPPNGQHFDRGAGYSRMDLDAFMQMFAPVHVVCHRELHIPWGERFCEDALRDALLIRRQGSLPVVDTRYLYRLHDQQTSLTADNSEFLRSYDAIVAEMRASAPEIARLFEHWRAVSGAYSLFARPGEHWCEFAERLRLAKLEAAEVAERVAGVMP